MKFFAMLVPASLCVFGSVATASADCGWVLWQETAGSMTPVRGFRTPEQCVRGITLAVDGFTTGDTVPRTSKEVHVTMGGSTVVYRYDCLPDTTDPRVPTSQEQPFDACAWVLWRLRSVADAGAYVRSAEPFKTFHDAANCQDSRAEAPHSRRVAAELKDAARKAKPAADLRLFSISNELHSAAWVRDVRASRAHLATDSFECLPDTIDPRGPKSK